MTSHRRCCPQRPRTRMASSLSPLPILILGYRPTIGVGAAEVEPGTAGVPQTCRTRNSTDRYGLIPMWPLSRGFVNEPHLVRARTTISRWTHGFESRWDYGGQRPCSELRTSPGPA